VIGVARDRVYSMTLDTKDEDKGPARFEAYISRVQRDTILNVRELVPDSPSGPWHYARYTQPRDYVVLFDLVDDDVLKHVTTPESARAGIERLSKRADLYWPFLVCVRTKPPR
jgi:hypothetical protein